MSDTYTEVTSRSWFSRLAESIKSVLVGGVLFLAAFPLLFWNEGRAVRTAKSLEEGAAAVVSVASDRVDPAHEQRLVHMTGLATTTETLTDPDFGVSVNAIKLERRAEMYQWKETSRSETRKKLGGGEETVTKYEYSRTWSDDLIESGRFKRPEGHENPSGMPVSHQTLVARKVTLGAFTLSEAQVGKLDAAEPLRLTAEASAGLPAGARVHDGGFFIGANPGAPAVGDVRISFRVVRPQTVSLVARQVGDSFDAYAARAGDTILLVKSGAHGAEAMFKAAQQANVVLTWVLRGVGFFVMFLGLAMVFRPLAVLADVIPILGTLLGAGLSVFAALAAAAFSTATIAVAWVVYRPLLGITLLVLALGALAALVWLGLRGRRAVAARVPAPAVGR